MGARADSIRRWGLWRTVYSAVSWRLGRFLGARLFVVYLRPHHGMAERHEAGGGVEFKVLDWDELYAFAQDPLLELDPSFLDEARARGHLCVGALDRGRLVAYVWRAFGPAPAEDGMWVRFRPPYRYGYKAFTDPEYRGMHLQSAIAPVTDRMLLDRGYTHAISFVDSANFASKRSAVRHGNEAIGYAGYLRAFGRAWTFRSPGARRHGFSFFDPRTDSGSTATP